MRFVTLDLIASRRRILIGAAGVTLGGLLAASAAAAPPAPAKSSQKSVEYQDHPKAGHSCNTCRDFMAPQSCRSVEGYIQPSGWCDKYTHL